MSFDQSLVLILLGAILGSGGAILAGKTVLKRKGAESEDLEEFLRALRARKALEAEIEKEKGT